MSHAEVSVVVPCHNDARHIAAAITSVLTQTHAPSEVIVVDDGSTDESAAIIASFGPRVRLLSQANKGAAAARNAGVRAAQGALIAFLDGDDIWPENSLAARLNVLTATGADLVFGQVRQCRGDAGPQAPGLGPDLPGRLAGAMLIRRTVFDRVGPFDERLATAETIDWVARAADAGIKEAGCDALVLYRRIHGANLMMRNHDTNSNALAVLRAAVARRRAAPEVTS
ncbi:MAG: glycosyltransferase family 2 protein [Polymorphobacter sp.]|uniref:glycosyltransferase family 2 protein n=1 Tax=Polymorphobacter sp. TaxID=1909290 RepID=UPI003A8847AC